jgi:hypothetical protein
MLRFAGLLIVGTGDALAELPGSGPERPGKPRYALGAEEQEDDDQKDQQFRASYLGKCFLNCRTGAL